MKTLTNAEEQIMQILWKIGKGFLKEILDEIPEPKPHSNTVATILRILVDKKFADYEVYGRQHQYFALMSKEEYSNGTLKEIIGDYFDGSYKEAVSFFVERDKLSIKDLELLLNELKKK
ncbi:MAG: BlaI/MecI/CopY family transcriptional regulator [Flavobacteriaceae bacterium]|nr:BlaI/MecI/CopY family transcriptional regulator [Flavobacteriaceae bacterium]